LSFQSVQKTQNLIGTDKTSHVSERMVLKMNDKLKNPYTNNLFKGILSLDTVEECYNFFEDLCTVAELQEMARRLAAAKMLKSGAKYTEISEKTGLSTATISRVNRSLKYGSDGYNSVLSRIEYEE